MTILHFHDRKTITVPVSGAETLALIACYGNAGLPTDADRATAAQLLMHLRDKEAWLACDCRADVQPPPLMSPRLRQGHIHIWRHGVTAHDPVCPFYVPQDDTPSTESVRWKSDWLRLKQSSGKSNPRGSAGTAEPKSSQHREPAEPVALQVLDAVLEEAGYNIVAPDDVRTMKDRPALSARRDAYAALERLRDTPVGADLTWGDVACSYLPALPSHLKHLESLVSRFPEGTRPQGAFIGIVNEILRESRFAHTLVWRTGKEAERVAVASIEGALHFGPASDAHVGPFWVFAQLAQRPGEKRFVALSAAARPVLSKSVLLPLDSPKERATAEMLLAQITYWARAMGITAQLEKPLHEEIAPDGTACKPDFLLWLPNGKRILIEAMSEDKSLDHLKNKLRQHAAMRQLPDVVTLIEHTSDDDPKALARKLTAIAAKACGVARNVESADK